MTTGQPGPGVAQQPDHAGMWISLFQQDDAKKHSLEIRCY